MEANGFYDGGFFKGVIPFLYRVYEMKLLTLLKKQNNNKVEIFEYFRGEWTYHTKGMWVYENQENPSLTLIGSSNYSQRSFKRDNEIQFYVYSFCPKFKERLQEESKRQFEHGTKVSLEQIKGDSEVQVKWRHKFIYFILKSFL